MEVGQFHLRRHFVGGLERGLFGNRYLFRKNLLILKGKKNSGALEPNPFLSLENGWEQNPVNVHFLDPDLPYDNANLQVRTTCYKNKTFGHGGYFPGSSDFYLSGVYGSLSRGELAHIQRVAQERLTIDERRMDCEALPWKRKSSPICVVKHEWGVMDINFGPASGIVGKRVSQSIDSDFTGRSQALPCPLARWRLLSLHFHGQCPELGKPRRHKCSLGAVCKNAKLAPGEIRGELLCPRLRHPHVNF